MSVIKERRRIFAKILTEEGVDLSRSYYSQPQSKLDVIRKYCQVFGFRSSNPSRSNSEQFYYSAQMGVEK